MTRAEPGATHHDARHSEEVISARARANQSAPVSEGSAAGNAAKLSASLLVEPLEPLVPWRFRPFAFCFET